MTINLNLCDLGGVEGYENPRSLDYHQQPLHEQPNPSVALKEEEAV